MNEQQGAPRVVDPADRTIRARRLDALQRVHRANEILAHEARLAERYHRDPDPGAIGASTEATEPGGPAARNVSSGSDWTSAADPDGPIDLDELLSLDDADDPPVIDPRAADDAERVADRDRLIEIHDSLRHERQIARRPFHHRHADRLVVALELAERLALDRLGFDDYADFEAHGGEQRRARDIVDVDQIERAARDLAEAEAELAALGTPVDPTGRPRPVIQLSPWTVDPVLREAQVRPTETRRRAFDEEDASAADRAVATAAVAAASDAIDVIGDPPRPRPRPIIDAGPLAPLLPFRRPRRADDSPEDAVERARETTGSEGADDGVLGELVRDGRTFRVEKVPGVTYAESEEGTGLRPDSITYGDPRRLI